MRARVRLRDQHRVGLDLDVELQRPRIGEQLEEVLAEQQLAAAENQEHRAGRRQLIEHVLHFGRRHLAVIVVVEIAVHATLVAAIRQIEMHRQRNADSAHDPDRLHQALHHAIPSFRRPPRGW